MNTLHTIVSEGIIVHPLKGVKVLEGTTKAFVDCYYYKSRLHYVGFLESNHE